MRSALDLLRDIRGTRRAIVVVGTMRELGGEAATLHQEVARAVLDLGPDAVVAVGDFVAAFKALGDRLSATKFIAGETPDDVGLELKELLAPGDVVLLKASRGVRLERLLSILWPSLVEAEAH